MTDDVSLSDLSKATLVAHTQELQEDYNRLMGQHEDELEELRSSLYEKDELLQEKEKTIERLKVRENHLSEVVHARDTQIRGLDRDVQNERRLKNRHIDLHAAANERVEEISKEAEVLQGSVEEISGHLREVSKDLLDLDTVNQKLQMDLGAVQKLNCSLAQKNRELLQKNQELVNDFQEHPATTDRQIKLAELRYRTAQSVIRWSALFFSIYSIGHFFAA